jgi:hypothetical protein
MAATAEALAAVRGDLSGDGARFMAALARVELPSPFGSIRLDGSRRAVAPVSSTGRIQGVEHTFNGYFAAGDPPPSRTTPACRRAQPPPWAR